MNDEFEFNNPAVGFLFLMIGFTTEAIQTIENLNVWLELILKVTSIISFFIFIFLNWKKIKQQWKEYFNKNESDKHLPKTKG
jgi:Na+/glutamate symporter